MIRLLRPLLGPNNICPFTIGCTEYTILQLQNEPFLIACKHIIQRLCMCNPITNIYKKNRSFY